MAAPAPTLAHRAEYLAFRTLGFAVSLISMESCAVLGGLLGGLFRRLSPRYRTLVRRNLRIATARHPLPPRELESLVRETFRLTGANFLSSVKCADLPAAELEQYVTTEGLEHLAPVHRGERGMVGLIPHMGNWEVMPKIGCLHAGEAPFGGVYRALNNPLMDEMTLRRRTADGARMFNRSDGFNAPIALLRTPGSMGVLADQRAGGRGVVLPFFGKLASCSPLPDLMARRAKADLSTIAIVTIGEGRWRITLRPLGPARGSAVIMEAMEEVMSRNLADVFWFHDRWRTDRTRPLCFYAPVDPEIARAAAVPLRVLLTTPEGEGEGPLEMIGKMFAARPDLRIDWLGAPLAVAPDPRVILHPWDRGAPPEQSGRMIDTIDGSHPAPLDAALLFGGTPAIARAVKRLGVRAILGADVRGRPWSRSLPRPTTPREWRRIVSELIYLTEAPEP